MTSDARGSGNEGGTLVELVVAAGITVVVGAMTLSAIVGPFANVAARLEPDPRRAALESGADAVARVLRAARPAGELPAIVDLAPHGITVAIGPPPAEDRIRIEVDVEGLVLEWSVAGEPGDVATTVLVPDLRPEDVRFLALDASGASVDDPARAALIVFDIVSGASRAMRTVALRGTGRHAGVTGW